MRTSSWIVLLGAAATAVLSQPNTAETDEEWFMKKEGQGCKCSGEFMLCKYIGKTSLKLRDRCQQQSTTIIIRASNTNSIPEDMFEGLYRIEWLYFEKSNITNLSPNLLRDMTSISLLSFNENRIKDIPEDLFLELDNLDMVHFSNNVIENIPVKLLAGHDTIKNIAFDGNRLKTLPKDVFKGLDKVFYLYLQRNQIETLPDGVFQDMKSLSHLDLSSNKLKVLTADIMTGPSTLLFCNLEGNTFTSLPSYDSRWPSFRIVKFHGSRITSLNETVGRTWLQPRDKATPTKVRISIKKSPLTNLKSLLWAVEDSSLNKTVESDCACGSITYKINSLLFCLSISCGPNSNPKNWIEAVKKTAISKTSNKQTQKDSSIQFQPDSNYAPSFAHSSTQYASSPFPQPTTQNTSSTMKVKPANSSHPSQYAPNFPHSSTLPASQSSSLSESQNHYAPLYSHASPLPRPMLQQPASSNINHVAFQTSTPSKLAQTTSKYSTPLFLPTSSPYPPSFSHSSLPTVSTSTTHSPAEYAPSFPHLHNSVTQTSTPETDMSHPSTQYAPSYPHTGEPKPSVSSPQFSQDLTIQQPAKPGYLDQYAPSFPHSSGTVSSTPSHSQYAPSFPHNHPPDSVNPQSSIRVTQSPPQRSSAPPQPLKFPTLSPPREQNEPSANNVIQTSPPSFKLNKPPLFHEPSREPTYPHNHPPVIRLLKQ